LIGHRVLPSARFFIEQKQNAEYIHHLAYYDALTDLPNRQLFRERCDHGLQQARRDHKSLALLFLDLDCFKHINDSLGHPVGDELIRVVAQRLKGNLRHGDTVARLDDDEFIILLENHPTLYDAEEVARKILQAMAQPFHVHGHKLEIGTSIGISMYPADDRSFVMDIPKDSNDMAITKAILALGHSLRLTVQGSLIKILGLAHRLIAHRPNRLLCACV